MISLIPFLNRKYSIDFSVKQILQIISVIGPVQGQVGLSQKPEKPKRQESMLKNFPVTSRNENMIIARRSCAIIFLSSLSGKKLEKL